MCSDYTCSSQVDKDKERGHSDDWEYPEQLLPSSLPVSIIAQEFPQYVGCMWVHIHGIV